MEHIISILYSIQFPGFNIPKVRFFVDQIFFAIRFLNKSPIFSVILGAILIMIIFTIMEDKLTNANLCKKLGFDNLMARILCFSILFVIRFLSQSSIVTIICDAILMIIIGNKNGAYINITENVLIWFFSVDVANCLYVSMAHTTALFVIIFITILKLFDFIIFGDKTPMGFASCAMSIALTICLLYVDSRFYQGVKFTILFSDYTFDVCTSHRFGHYFISFCNLLSKKWCKLKEKLLKTLSQTFQAIKHRAIFIYQIINKTTIRIIKHFIETITIFIQQRIQSLYTLYRTNNPLPSIFIVLFENEMQYAQKKEQNSIAIYKTREVVFITTPPKRIFNSRPPPRKRWFSFF